MKICFVDDPAARDWRDARNRFLALHDMLAAAGHEVVFCDAPLTTSTNYLAGCESEGDAAPLLASARAVDMLKTVDAALTIFPLRGGLAHGLLMARACGEFPPDRRIAIWCDAPTRSVFLQSDATDLNLSPLVADALERATLELADALILPRAERLGLLTALGVDLPPIVSAAEALAPFARARPAEGPIESLVFIGAFARGAGAAAFVDAVESLWVRGRLDNLEIVFAGPIGDRPFAMGKEWLGLRAARWTFPFRVIPTDSLAEAMRPASRPGALGVALAHDVEDLPGAAGDDVLIASLGDARVNDLGDLIARAIEARLCGVATPQGATATPTHWPAVIDALNALPLRAPPVPAKEIALTVCTVHYERPSLLLHAIGSVGQSDAEIIIVDNGSSSAESHASLDELGRRQAIWIERLIQPLPYPVAYNHAAEFARGDYLVFLDDDNAFTPGGLERLRRACALGRFDIIVSNLALFDADAEEAPSPGVMTFIGPARSAGLFFNGFGDTCLAIRREAFLEIGGFRDAVAAYPGADWVMLSRAQAAGMKIGVLQQPAYRYRRDPGRAHSNWQKFDRHGVRTLVFDGYGSSYDPQLVAKYAQGLWLSTR